MFNETLSVWSLSLHRYEYQLLSCDSYHSNAPYFVVCFRYFRLPSSSVVMPSSFRRLQIISHFRVRLSACLPYYLPFLPFSFSPPFSFSQDGSRPHSYRFVLLTRWLSAMCPTWPKTITAGTIFLTKQCRSTTSSCKCSDLYKFIAYIEGKDSPGWLAYQRLWLCSR